MRKTVLFAASVLAAGLLAAPVLSQQTSSLPDLEKAFDSHISPPEMGGWMKKMAAESNHVGSPHDKANAEDTLARFKAWGWDAKIETAWVLYPTPKEVLLELASGPGAPVSCSLLGLLKSRKIAVALRCTPLLVCLAYFSVYALLQRLLLRALVLATPTA